MEQKWRRKIKISKGILSFKEVRKENELLLKDVDLDYFLIICGNLNGSKIDDYLKIATGNHYSLPFKQKKMFSIFIV